MTLADLRRVLILAAHPDDEVIGCGGTIRRLADAGASITVAIATTGDTGRSESLRELAGLTERRRTESTDSKTLLGINELVFLDHPTQGLANDRDTFQQYVKLIRNTTPDLVLSHADDDKHRDHRTVSALAREAVWKAWENVMPELGPRHRVREHWLFEITDTFARPDVVVDVSGTLEAKLRALGEHRTQGEVLGDIGSFLRGLASVRGYAIGARYGEGYRTSSILPRSL